MITIIIELEKKVEKAARNSNGFFRAVAWSGREDLNLRPPRPERGALPGCATPRRNGLLYSNVLAAVKKGLLNFNAHLGIPLAKSLPVQTKEYSRVLLHEGAIFKPTVPPGKKYAGQFGLNSWRRTMHYSTASG